MNKSDELFNREKMEKGIAYILAHIKKGPQRIDFMMAPILTSCDEKERSITVEFPVLDWQLNVSDIMHGGAIATAFDDAFGVFAHYLNNNKTVVTVNITLNYLKPIPKGDAILITAKATSVGKKLITLSGECRLKSSGLLTNTAFGTFAVV